MFESAVFAWGFGALGLALGAVVAARRLSVGVRIGGAVVATLVGGAALVASLFVVKGVAVPAVWYLFGVLVGAFAVMPWRDAAWRARDGARTGAFAALLFGVFLWGLFSDTAADSVKPAAAESVPVAAESVKGGAAVSGGVCACDSGARCTGPRGGSYCVTAGGSKRYF